MVKNLIVDIGVIGTRSIQNIWIMRRQAVTQLNAFMALHAADVLEHERAHVPDSRMLYLLLRTLTLSSTIQHTMEKRLL